MSSAGPHRPKIPDDHRLPPTLVRPTRELDTAPPAPSPAAPPPPPAPRPDVPGTSHGAPFPFAKELAAPVLAPNAPAIPPLAPPLQPKNEWDNFSETTLNGGFAISGNLGPSLRAVDDAAEPHGPKPPAILKLDRLAPPWLISLLVHMLLLLSLGLVPLRPHEQRQVQLSASYGQLDAPPIDDLETPQLQMEGDENPVLAFDLREVEMPFAAPPPWATNLTEGNRLISPLEAPAIGLALTGREPGMKKAMLAAYGGTAATEEAVIAGLEWLKRQQMRDGGWSLTGPYPDGAHVENRCAATAMALLAFQGYGSTHRPNPHLSPDYHQVVERGWNYLLKTLDKDGFFVHEGSHNQRMYAQAQATIALCELYGMTKDPKLRQPAQLALDFAHKAQNPELGGWRYEPRIDSDLSVTGWYVMALQSGLMAGLEVQSPNLALANQFLDKVAYDGGSQYRYQPIREQPSIAMTAEGLLCRQYLGWKRNDPRLLRGVEKILAHPIDYGEPNVYYWYYATQVMHHMEGEWWERWNRQLRQEVPAAQIKTGSQRGSWSSTSDPWGAHGGRLYTTCLSIYLLEVYYRHLPLYSEVVR